MPTAFLLFPLAPIAASQLAQPPPSPDRLLTFKHATKPKQARAREKQVARPELIR